MREGRRAVLTGILGAVVGVLLVGGLVQLTGPPLQFVSLVGEESAGPSRKTATDTATATAGSAADAPPGAAAPVVRGAMVESQRGSGTTPQTVSEVARLSPGGMGVILLPFVIAGLVAAIIYAVLRRRNQPAESGSQTPAAPA